MVRPRGSDEVSLYVHIPFCDVRCPYCHFYCFVNRDAQLPLRYVRALATEFDAYLDGGEFDAPLASVYFGGGTPSALPPDARAVLTQWIADSLVPRLSPQGEITVEVNPESAWAETIDPWVEAGVNRISVGIQSMDEETLKFLGRLNTPRSNLRALDLACARVENVSADLILGTPGGDWGKVLRSLEAICSRPVQHLSGYLLEVHAATRFGRDVKAGKWKPAPDEQQTGLYLRAVDWLQERGYEPYELSNFAHPGFESRHNARYWRRQPYLGLGASAHSYGGEQRWSNHRDAAAYCADVEAGKRPVDFRETLNADQQWEERILLGLRTREGVPLDWLRGREQLCAAWAAAHLVERNKGRLRATPAGWLVLDQMVAQLVQ